MNLQEAQTTRVHAACAAETAVVQARLDALTKPPGSLGRLEHIALRLARVYGDPPPALDPRAVLVFAADHGVAARGVSAYPQAVTAQMCRNIAAGGAAINAIAGAVGADVRLIDVGVAADLSGIAGIEVAKTAFGTRDMSMESAMTGAELAAALAAGAAAAASTPARIVALGEMGIANTTAAAAVTAALLRTPVSATVGRGTGIDDATWRHKCAIVETAVHRVASIQDPLIVLREVGGLDIAALAGAILAIAGSGRAVVLDGFITTAAALVAARLEPCVTDYLFAAHVSQEPGHMLQLRALGLEPMLDLNLRLGEGTGSALALPICDAAAAVLREMATFQSAGISGDRR